MQPLDGISPEGISPDGIISPKSVAARITRLHALAHPLGGFGSKGANSILDIFGTFLATAGPDALERMKNLIAIESTDLLDLTDLVADLPPAQRGRLLRLFASPIARPLDPRSTIKVISDLDNTIIESAGIAPVVYTPGDVAPGSMPLMRALASGTVTTMTMVSARPRILELHSIMKMRRTLENSAAPPFSFASGELKGPVRYVGACIGERLLGGRAAATWRHHKAVACMHFANKKMQCFVALQAAFPHAKFVFFGDDTQGDWIFAAMMVRQFPQSFAFIRRIATANTSVAPGSQNWPPDARTLEYIAATSPRILLHNSYYEALARSPDAILSPAARVSAWQGAIDEFTGNVHKYRNGTFRTGPLQEPVDRAWITVLTRMIRDMIISTAE